MVLADSFSLFDGINLSGVDCILEAEQTGLACGTDNGREGRLALSGIL